MKTNLLIFLTCFFLFTLLNFQAKANGNFGATITYTNLAPGTYFVTLKKYRECTVAAASTADLHIVAAGCNTGRTITMNLAGQNQIVTPYCNLVPRICGVAPNIYEIATYNATVTFSAAEQSCSDWLLSWNECCRPETENTVGLPQAYSEAFLKLGATINNNSAQVNILDETMPVFCLNEDVFHYLQAYDPDCDSLSYELVNPLSAANTPTTYKPFLQNGGVILNQNPQPPFNTLPSGHPNSNPQIAISPGYNQYSATFPIGSFHINWTPGQQ